MTTRQQRATRGGVAVLATAGLVASSFALAAPAAAAGVTDPDVVRISGPDRYATSVDAAEKAPGSFGDEVIIASGEAFPDALSGSALAGAKDAPILLTAADELPDSVADYLADAKPSTVNILGGTGAVSQAVEDEIKVILSASGVTVERFAGANRYATSQLIAEEVGDAGDLAGVYDDVVFLATGENFPDALGAGPQAYQGEHPIILTASDELSPEAAASITALNADYVIILGGTAAVSEDVEDAVSDLGVANVRISGASRYDTAATLATILVDLGELDPANIGLAAGQNFPDALSASAYLGEAAAPLVLLDGSSVPTATADFLEAQALVSKVLHVFGGTGVIPDSTVEEAKEATAAAEITAMISGVAGFREGTIEFSEEVEAAQAESPSSYTTTGVSIANIDLDSTGTMAEITFASTLAGGDTIAVKANTIPPTDGSERFVEAVTFTVAADTVGPELAISAVEGSDEVTVTANEPLQSGSLDSTEITLTSSFGTTIVTQTLTPGSGLSSVDPTTGVITIDLNQAAQGTDTITIDSGYVEDTSGNPNQAAEFVVAADTVAPIVDAATVGLEVAREADRVIAGGSGADLLIVANADGIAPGAIGNDWEVRVRDSGDAPVSVAVFEDDQELRIGAPMPIDIIELVEALNANAAFSADFTASVSGHPGDFDRELTRALTNGRTDVSAQVVWSEPYILATLAPDKHGIDIDGDGAQDITVADVVPVLSGTVTPDALAGTVDVTYRTEISGQLLVAGTSTLNVANGAAQDLSGNPNTVAVVPFTSS